MEINGNKYLQEKLKITIDEFELINSQLMEQKTTNIKIKDEKEDTIKK